MAKHKSPQELMATRNPLTRASVTPVDIYKQALPPVTTSEPEQERQRRPDESLQKQVLERTAARKTAVTQLKNEGERIVPYSTYLIPEVIKKIKWRALERDTKDYQIVQEAIDEYFERHPLPKRQ